MCVYKHETPPTLGATHILYIPPITQLRLQTRSRIAIYHKVVIDIPHLLWPSERLSTIGRAASPASYNKYSHLRTLQSISASSSPKVLCTSLSHYGDQGIPGSAGCVPVFVGLASGKVSSQLPLHFLHSFPHWYTDVVYIPHTQIAHYSWTGHKYWYIHHVLVYHDLYKIIYTTLCAGSVLILHSLAQSPRTVCPDLKQSQTPLWAAKSYPQMWYIHQHIIV